MLKPFERQRLGRRDTVPCESIPHGRMRVESYTGAGVTIFNSLTAVGLKRWFCTWSDAIGIASGQSLQYPWRSLRGDGAEVGSGDAVIVVRQTQRSVIAVTRRDGGARLTVKEVGWPNDVIVQRDDGTTLARFPARGSWIRIDLEPMSDDERLMFLTLLGAGVVRRARRFGILARAWLPSAVD